LTPQLIDQKKINPHNQIVERYVQVRSCKYIDEVVPYVTEQDLIDILSSFKIDLRIIGEEYKEKFYRKRIL
jgi:glycerol-3-phosphate cytidylyltransferase